uniref:Ig-like receptor 1 n=1 Tax=Xenopus tropicalis TaxID=8364 RepID=A0A803JWY1_XENTR
MKSLLSLSVAAVYTLQNRRILASEAERVDYPRISVIPSLYIDIGSNVTIQCQGTKQEDKFILYKNGAPLIEGPLVGQTANFYLQDARKTDAGNYFCMRKSDARITNHKTITVKGADDTVQIWALPSTNISVGGNLTILCQRAEQGDTFVLYKDEDIVSEQEPAGGIAQFHLYHVQAKNAGIYYCLRKSSQSKVKFSNQIHVTIEGADDTVQIWALPSTNISVGGNLTILCQRAEQGDTFVLYKDEDIVSEQEPAGAIAQFHIYHVQPKDTGPYYCLRKSSQSDFELSDQIDIIIEGTGNEVSRQNTDYTISNTVRLALAGLLLTVTILLATENCHTKKSQLQNEELSHYHYNIYSIQC